MGDNCRVVNVTLEVEHGSDARSFSVRQRCTVITLSDTGRLVNTVEERLNGGKYRQENRFALNYCR